MFCRSMTSSLAALLLLGARAQSDCFQTGVMYVGNRVIAPGYVHNADACQFQCTAAYACAYFTYEAHGNATANQGPGVCLKYDSQAVLVPTSDNDTISGPVRCPTANTTAPPATAASTSAAPTAAGPTAAGPTAAVPTGVPVNGTIEINGTKVNCTNLTNSSTCEVLPDGKGSFPWWAVLLIALVIIGVGAAVIYGTCDSAKKKKKSKKSKKVKESRSSAAAVEAGEAAALVRTEAPPPIVEPAMIVEPPVVMPAAASPMAAMSTASPVYQQPMQPMQQMVYTSGGQVVQMQQQPQVQFQMPVLSGGARSPQFR